MSIDNVAAPRTDPAVSAAVRATYAAFIASGFAFATWASRIPQMRDHLHLSPAQLGLLLLSIASGSMLALPLSGPVVTRFGSQATVTITAILEGVALAVVAFGYQLGVFVVVVGLFGLGWSVGLWDVAMNVQGALAERRLGKAIMPRFHAGYSLGTVVGALVGAGMVAVPVSVTVHLLAVAVIIAAVVPYAVRGFIPDDAAREEFGSGSAAGDGSPRTGSTRGALAPWREPRTLLIGLFVLAFAFAEGTGNDWVSVAMIDGYDLSAAMGTLAFAVFLSAMTAGRWFGPGLLDRYGRVSVVRALAVLGVIGLVLFVFGQSPVVAFIGTVMWGIGVSLGFPVGMSAGADDPRQAAGRVSVIASIGYCAFLGGPPLVGFLGDHIGVLRAVTAVAVLLALATAIASTVRPPARETTEGIEPVTRGV